MDESGSMSAGQTWIKKIVPDLQRDLLNLGIGQHPSTPNLYGLVGFGKWRYVHGHLSHTLTLGDSKTMYPLSEFERVLQLLEIDSASMIEDGYEAIHHALKNITLRNAENIGRIMILITDEERDEATGAKELSRERIKTFLLEKQIVLHVIVNNRIIVGGHPAFGMNSSMWAFVEIHPSGIIALPGAQFGAALYTTQRDYAQLALELNGTAWDEAMVGMGQLTKAFVEVVTNQSKHLSTTSQQCKPRQNVSNCDTSKYELAIWASSTFLVASLDLPCLLLTAFFSFDLSE